MKILKKDCKIILLEMVLHLQKDMVFLKEVMFLQIRMVLSKYGNKMKHLLK